MDARRKKLKFRANHRGFKEMDLMMGHFAEAELDAMSDAELDQFEALLEAPDQEVYSWIVGSVAPPREHEGEVLRKLRAFDLSAILQKRS